MAWLPKTATAPAAERLTVVLGRSLLTTENHCGGSICCQPLRAGVRRNRPQRWTATALAAGSALAPAPHKSPRAIALAPDAWPASNLVQASVEVNCSHWPPAPTWPASRNRYPQSYRSYNATQASIPISLHCLRPTNPWRCPLRVLKPLGCRRGGQGTHSIQSIIGCAPTVRVLTFR